jgi:hypothetical protein
VGDLRRGERFGGPVSGGVAAAQIGKRDLAVGALV